MRAKGILDSLPILAVAFGRRQGVEVVVGGSVACTDGKRIHLPDLPLDASEDLETLAFGYLFHETGHIEYTDMTVFKEAGEEDPFLMGMLNVFEDIRMEAERNSNYPGSARSLSRLSGLLAKRGQFGTAEDVAKATPKQVLPTALITRLRHEVLGQPVGEVAALWAERLNGMLGKGAQVKLEALLGEVPMLDTTRDALELAKRVQTLIKEEAERQEQEQQQQAQAQQQQGQGQGDGQGQGQQNGDGQDQSQPQDAGQDQGSDEGSGQDQPKGQGQVSGSEDCQDPDSQGQGAGNGKRDDPTAAGQMLDAGDEDFDRTNVGKMAAGELSTDADDEVRKEARAGGGASASSPEDVRMAPKGKNELPGVLQASQRMRSRLALAMQSQARRKVEHRRSGHRVDGRVAHRLFQGSTRIFEHKSDVRAVNTAVQLLLDVSGSMCGERVIVARQAMLAAAVGISQIHGCKVAAAAFPELQIMKEFEEAARTAAPRFGIDASGGTPMAEALVWAAANLKPRHEARKMVIVATDGAPNDPASVKEIIRRYGISGIEVIGVGIQTDYVQQLFPVWTSINQVTELADAIFGLLHQRMRRCA